MELSKEPYKGTRDFYPEDMYLQNYIFNTMRKVVEVYGYAEYGASILEETALYKAKTGEEIVNEQTYSFTDRGGRDITIRPEMTPTVARMVARKRQELAFPLRWYSIPNLFRYERPQRGRLREHWQLNVDVFGIEAVDADAEIISISYEIMKAFGAKDGNFSIRVNNRKLINFILGEYIGVNSEGSYRLSKIIDKKDKVTPEAFAEQVNTVLGNNASKLLAILDTKSVSELASLIPANDGIQDILLLTEKLARKNIKNIVFEPSLMRGFDYYTGTVFEVFDTNPVNNRSLFGGGRYDDLVGLFDVEKICGVGFGMGDVTIRDYIETYNLLPTYTAQAQIYLCPTDSQYNSAADELADYLRANNIRAAIDYTDRKLAAKLKTADRQAVPYVICIGEDETKNNTYKLKTLATRTEQELNKDELLTVLKGKE